jgi:hypothetical protein
MVFFPSFLFKTPKELTENMDLLLRKLLSPWLLWKRGDILPAYPYASLSLAAYFMTNFLGSLSLSPSLFFLKLKVTIELELELLKLVLLLLDLSWDLSFWCLIFNLGRYFYILIGEFFERVDISESIEISLSILLS